MSKVVRTFRIDPEDEALVEAAARRRDQAPSTFIREAAVACAIRYLTKGRVAVGGLQEPTTEEAA